MHGAGLVHLWWLTDNALMFELVPQAQISNPSFQMLSTLTGRRYHGYVIKGTFEKIQITVNTQDVIKELIKQYPSLNPT